MRRDREGATNRRGGRIREAVEAKKSRRDDHEEAACEQRARAQMAMVTSIRTGVADDANDGRHRDEGPLETFAHEVSKSEEGQHAGEKRQRDTMNRAGCRNDNSSPLQARSAFRSRLPHY